MKTIGSFYSTFWLPRCEDAEGIALETVEFSKHQAGLNELDWINLGNCRNASLSLKNVTKQISPFTSWSKQWRHKATSQSGERERKLKANEQNMMRI